MISFNSISDIIKLPQCQVGATITLFDGDSEVIAGRVEEVRLAARTGSAATLVIAAPARQVVISDEWLNAHFQGQRFVSFAQASSVTPAQQQQQQTARLQGGEPDGGALEERLVAAMKRQIVDVVQPLQDQQQQLQQQLRELQGQRRQREDVQFFGGAAGGGAACGAGSVAPVTSSASRTLIPSNLKAISLAAEWSAGTTNFAAIAEAVKVRINDLARSKKDPDSFEHWLAVDMTLALASIGAAEEILVGTPECRGHTLGELAQSSAAINAVLLSLKRMEMDLARIEFILDEGFYAQIAEESNKRNHVTNVQATLYGLEPTETEKQARKMTLDIARANSVFSTASFGGGGGGGGGNNSKSAFRHVVAKNGKSGGRR